jgi:hypothetical protein
MDDKILDVAGWMMFAFLLLVTVAVAVSFPIMLLFAAPCCLLMWVMVSGITRDAWPQTDQRPRPFSSDIARPQAPATDPEPCHCTNCLNRRAW